MSLQDVCFLGILALTYVYLDAWQQGRAMRHVPHDGAPRALPPPQPLLALPRPPASSLPCCPRRAGHTVSLRPDGALWCRECDEAYFPELPELAAEALAEA